jgi:hypothetical protein
MKPCQMAPNGSCPHEAAATVRIDTVGDRSLCRTHADFVVGQGFGRELDVNAFKPRWVTEGKLARDFTGRVLA